jgi:excisionase family DNA binding protein
VVLAGSPEVRLSSLASIVYNPAVTTDGKKGGVMEERRLSLKEAQAELGISERTIHRWIKSGKLKSFKPGRDHQIPESAIRKVLQESEVYPKVQSPLPFNDVAGSETELLRGVLDAARQDMERESQAVARAIASEGQVQSMTEFAEDKVRWELRAAGVSNELFEGFIWPLVVRLARVEQENARLREEVRAGAHV